MTHAIGMECSNDLATHANDKVLIDGGMFEFNLEFALQRTVIEMLAGIRKVAAGEFAMGPKVQERVQAAKEHSATGAGPWGGNGAGADKKPVSKLGLLTAREQEVLRLIGRCMSRNQIAATLGRSPKTVDGHRELIMKKLDIHDRGELVRFAIREGLAEM